MKYLVVVVATLFGSEAWAQRVNVEKLRAAVAVPPPPINYESGGELVPRADVELAIKKLLNQMRGDVGDAEQYLKLAALYGKKKPELQSEGIRKAALLTEKQVQAGTASASETAIHGLALLQLDRKEEGGRFIKRAIEAEPENYRCWQGKWAWHGTELLSSMGGDEFSVKWNSGIDLPLRGGGIPSLEKIRAAEIHVNAMKECYEKLSRLLPSTEEGIEERIDCFVMLRAAEALVRGAKGKGSFEEGAQIWIHPNIFEGLLDLGRKRKNCVLTHVKAVEIWLFIAEIENVKLGRDKWTSEQKATLARALEPLIQLSESEDSDIAWTSSLVTGCFSRYIDQEKGERFFLSAMRHRPDRNQPVETLVMLYTKDKDAAKALSMLDQQYARNPTMSTGLALAHVLGVQKEQTKIKRVVEDLAKRHAAEIPCQLALAAVCLAESAEKERLAKAREHLDSAGMAIDAAADQESNTPSETRKSQFKFNIPSIADHKLRWRYLNAVYLGLTDQPLQSWVELAELRRSGTFSSLVSLALNAFED